MSFHIGQKVECVDADPDRFGRESNLVKGRVYTIADIYQELGRTAVSLYESKPGDGCFGWWAHRFRPIVERKTDIGFAHGILRKATRKQGADA